MDFSNDAAADAINAWTSTQTHGKIPKLFDDLDPSTVLVLANAVYFHADWQTKFNKAETRPGPFTTAAGAQVDVDYMNGGAGLQGAVTDDYQGSAAAVQRWPVRRPGGHADPGFADRLRRFAHP